MTRPPTTRLAASTPQVSPAVLAALAAAVQRTAPDEICGILLGRPPGAGRPAALRAWLPTANLAVHPGRSFVLDPQVLAQWLPPAPAGHPLVAVAVCHSHPAGPAWPSSSDRRAAWPELLQAIIGRPSDGRSGRLELALFEPTDWRRLARWQLPSADQKRSV